MQQWFSNPKLAPLWTVIRFWLGYQWLTSGWGKLNNPAWTGEKAPAAIMGFFKGVLEKAQTGANPEVKAWYADFVSSVAMPNAKFFSYLIPYAEVLAGLGLIVGCLTTIALLGGITMNLNFLWAGTSSTNPQMMLLSLFLLFAGAYSYRYGVDHYLLPWLKQLRTGRNPSAPIPSPQK
ncbi:DoxX family membrane protein [Heliobacterium undosum]|uniref:DoxX family membrane protein n=1 Tax=Heliomicrobium undosum TaxID=121734 RepID=A0A845KY26_9FIRM|nr:DoxX family protein [Heliomicrobium undosum]MZP28642.1 DoxX family membrane protein [Heliomicrobium undosum]